MLSETNLMEKDKYCMILLICGMQNKLINTENKVVPEGKELGDWMKGAKRVNGIVNDGNEAFDGDHFVVYTHVELWCCTPETYIMLYTILPKKKKDID